jgi:hypothetical protein
MGIRDRIRAWAEPPPLPELADGERMLIEGMGRRSPIGISRKYAYTSVGRMGLTDQRLIYVEHPRTTNRREDIEIAWSGVTGAKLDLGLGKFMRAPTPYFFWLFMHHPIFTLTVDGQEQRFQIISEQDWRPAIDELRIRYPVLDPLAGR